MDNATNPTDSSLKFDLSSPIVKEILALLTLASSISLLICTFGQASSSRYYPRIVNKTNKKIMLKIGLFWTCSLLFTKRFGPLGIEILEVTQYRSFVLNPKKWLRLWQFFGVEFCFLLLDNYGLDRKIIIVEQMLLPFAQQGMVFEIREEGIFQNNSCIGIWVEPLDENLDLNSAKLFEISELELRKTV